MPRILDEPVAESPLWLEVAGYPEYLNGKIRAGAWSVFKKLVELDCEDNARPDVFTASIGLIAERTGLDGKIVTRVVKALRKEQMLRFFLPEHDDEPAMFQFITPFQPPAPVETIRERLAAMAVSKAERLRYIDELPWRGPAADSDVKEVVDAYLDTFGLRLNSFTLDELALLAGRFALEEIRAAFERAIQMQRPSLRWAIQDLVQRKKKAQSKELS
jgi:hypothetical protein